ncbi:MAG TPA: hypothetical protein VKY65_03000 [Alphaproteobacteria bacterium]|nr:hypothetical protein [Alphaproteobacteria bacterium]
MKDMGLEVVAWSRLDERALPKIGVVDDWADVEASWRSLTILALVALVSVTVCVTHPVQIAGSFGWL